MTGRRAIFLTARRELLERVRGRAFLISTGLVLALVLGIFVLSAATGDGPEELRVAVVGDRATEVSEIASSQGEGLGVDIEAMEVTTIAEAEAAVRDGDADLALTDDGLLTDSEPSELGVGVIEGAARSLELQDRLREEGLSAADADRVLSTSPLEIQQVPGTGESGAGLAVFASIVLYLAIFTGGLQVATGVVEEKGSRVVELILSAIDSKHLLVGKVLGIGLAAFLQLALVFGLWVGLAAGTGEIDLPDSAASTTILAVIYFLLGYAFYACAFAAAAALVSRQEDVQSTTAPMMVALVGSYFISIGVIEDPSSTLARISTILPPVAPMVVPVRAAQDALPVGDLIASLAAMVIGTLVLIAIGARIYDRSVLRMGAPIKLKQAFRLLR